MNDLKENMIFDLSKTAFVAIDMQKEIVNNGTLSPHTAASILTNNDLLVRTLKRTAALKVLVNVDISTFPYLSQQTDMGGMTASVPPEFTDLLLKDSLKDTDNMLTIKKYNPSAFLVLLLIFNFAGVESKLSFKRCSDNKRCICYCIRCLSTRVPYRAC